MIEKIISSKPFYDNYEHNKNKINQMGKGVLKLWRNQGK